MGWFWSSQAVSKATRPSSPDTTPIQDPPKATQPRPAPPRELTADETAERDLTAWLESLEADVKPSSTKYNRVPQPGPSQQVPSNLSLEDELLPIDMSCRQAFDAAFYCQSLGGQFNNLYRYGSIRSCSENWSDFWFCMRSKGVGDVEREKNIRDHYKRKTMKYKVGPSSEDVWEVRTKKLDWAEAFSLPTEEVAVSDEEWNHKESLRREQKRSG